jgi:AICAR transformylase/IMP cyclohydrolase PurH (only IMP cyclohydrolase domain in Aful)
LIRAAAKNWDRVIIAKNEHDYGIIAEELRSNGNVSAETMKNLAIDAFRYTSRYDEKIMASLTGLKSETITLNDGRLLRYGENPSQKGTLYEKSEFGSMEVFHGKEMSYNNYVDASAAIDTALDFKEPFAVVMKHNTPCGAATGKTLGEALEKAIDSDRESAYGSVICLNGIADEEAVNPIGKLFVEILIARDFTEDALSILSKKKILRLIRYYGKGPEKNFKTIFNGILEQDRMDTEIKELKCINTGDVDFDRSEIEFAWKVVAHCKSNAIVLTKNRAIVGVGAGQTSRVEAVKIACERAGMKAQGSLMASDAYFPFSDSVDIASKYGVKGVVEPGGSIRDDEVIAACKDANLSLYFTGMRVFLH